MVSLAAVFWTDPEGVNRLYKSHPFKGSVRSVPLCQLLRVYTLRFRLDMVDIFPQASDPKLERTTNSRSPHSQKCKINEVISQTHKIYHFQNCGTLYMDSFNTQGVSFENCGNNVQQVTCSLSFSSHSCFFI